MEPQFVPNRCWKFFLFHNKIIVYSLSPEHLWKSFWRKICTPLGDFWSYFFFLLFCHLFGRMQILPCIGCRSRLCIVYLYFQFRVVSLYVWVVFFLAFQIIQHVLIALVLQNPTCVLTIIVIHRIQTNECIAFSRQLCHHININENY